MASAGSTLAEAYVMRKLHREKMKSMDKAADHHHDETTRTAAMKDSGGCLCGIFRKIHPTAAAVPPADSCKRKDAAGCVNTTLSSVGLTE